MLNGNVLTKFGISRFYNSWDHAFTQTDRHGFIGSADDPEQEYIHTYYIYIYTYFMGSPMPLSSYYINLHNFSIPFLTIFHL